MSELVYSTGRPSKSGIYACRIVDEALSVHGLTLYEDVFLIWLDEDGEWFYVRSDQKYRGEVPFWLGPLPRK